MAIDDTEDETHEQLLVVLENQQEEFQETGVAASCSQIRRDDNGDRTSVRGKGKKSLLLFSRSAETVADQSIDHKQPGQRPDRLHARRPSTARRSCCSEQNWAGSRCPSNKTVQRVSKASQLRGSKSCTKECEILRSDYGNDYSATYSALLEGLLKSDDSTIFTGGEEDDIDYVQEDATLSESTTLIIGNDDGDAKSDITTTSEDEANPSTGQSLVKKALAGHTSDRRGSRGSAGSRKINALGKGSDSCLLCDSSLTEKEQVSVVSDVDLVEESQSRVDEAETRKEWKAWNYGDGNVEAEYSCSEESHVTNADPANVLSLTLRNRVPSETSDQSTQPKVGLLEKTHHSTQLKVGLLEKAHHSTQLKVGPLDKTHQSTQSNVGTLEKVDQSTQSKVGPLEKTDQSKQPKVGTNQYTQPKVGPLERTNQSTVQKADTLEKLDQSAAQKVDPFDRSDQSAVQKVDPLDRPDQSAVKRFITLKVNEQTLHTFRHLTRPEDERTEKCEIVSSFKGKDVKIPTRQRLISKFLAKNTSDALKTLSDSSCDQSKQKVPLEVPQIGSSNESIHGCQRNTHNSNDLSDVYLTKTPLIGVNVSMGEQRDLSRPSLFEVVQGIEPRNGTSPFLINSHTMVDRELTNVFQEISPGYDKHTDVMLSPSKNPDGPLKKLVLSSDSAANCRKSSMTHLTRHEDQQIDYLMKLPSNCHTTYSDSDPERLNTFSMKVPDEGLTRTKAEKSEPDSPAISILSFNSIREVAENAMSSRRDHNDVYYGDKLLKVYSNCSLTSSPRPNSGQSSGVSPVRRGDVGHKTEESASLGVKTGESANLGARMGESASLCARTGESASLGDKTGESASLGDKTGESASLDARMGESASLGARTSMTVSVNNPESDDKNGCGNISSICSSLAPTKQAGQQLANPSRGPPNTSTDQCKNADQICSQSETSLHSHNMHLPDSTRDSLSEIHNPNIEPATGRENKDAEGPAKDTDTPVARTVSSSFAKLSVPSRVTHEYLPFLNKLRNDTEKAAKRESVRQQNKVNKQQRKQQESLRKSAAPSEDDCQADIESAASTPVCPIGHEVPPEWRPGRHSSHPLTQISASYTFRKVKTHRRSKFRRTKTQTWTAPKTTRSIDSGNSKANVNLSNVEGTVDPHLGVAESDPALGSFPTKRKSSTADTADNQEAHNYRHSFEGKGGYYQQLDPDTTTVRAETYMVDHGPLPKRITSQVRLLKTLDDLYSSSSSDDIEVDTFVNKSSALDRNHQISLINYYTTRLRHLSVLENVPPRKCDRSLSGIRIRKAVQEVPSALDSKRLKSLYDCRSKKASGSKLRKASSADLIPGRPETSQGGANKCAKDVCPLKGYSRSAPKLQQQSKTSSSRDHTLHGCPEDADRATLLKETMDYQQLVGEAAMLFPSKVRQKSYSDGWKSNIDSPSQEVRAHQARSLCLVGDTNAPGQNAPSYQYAPNPESNRPACTEECAGQPTSQIKAKDGSRRSKLRVRFADSHNEVNKERPVWEMSEEDTWCSSVNAMLLRADKVMDDSAKNDHRYPKPDSARVVSPVPPKSPTFLKELLKQDTIDRKHAKGQTLQDKKSRDNSSKHDRHDTRPCKTITSSFTMAPYTTHSMLSVQHQSEPSDAGAKSCLVYTVPMEEGAQQANINEKSAGVLKISIQMSKRAQERAWLTHERLKHQGPLTPDYERGTESKALPKKLAPLRYPRPINFQNPDTRGHERVPVREMKALAGLGAQTCVRPRAAVEGSSVGQKSNFLLDQHSETLHYYRVPGMYDRTSSIVPLFSDSNNNAFLESKTEAESQVEHSESETCVTTKTQPQGESSPSLNDNQRMSAGDDESRVARKTASGNNITDSSNSWQKIHELTESVTEDSRCFPDFVPCDNFFTSDGLYPINSEYVEQSDHTESVTQPHTKQKVLSTLNKDEMRSTFPIYISGMRCFVSNVSGRETSAGQQCVGDTSKETLLDALLDYEAEKASQEMQKNSPASSNVSQRSVTWETNVGDACNSDAIVGDNATTCGDLYHAKKWVPNYMDEEQASEMPLELIQALDIPSGCAEDEGEESDKETMKAHQPTGCPDPDAIDMSDYLQELYLEKGMTHSSVNNTRQYPDFLPRRNVELKRRLQGIPESFQCVNNFALQGCSVSLNKKASINSFLERKMKGSLQLDPRVFPLKQTRNVQEDTTRAYSATTRLGEAHKSRPFSCKVNLIEQKLKNTALKSYKLSDTCVNVYSPMRFNREQEMTRGAGVIIGNKQGEISQQRRSEEAATKEGDTSKARDDPGVFEQIFKDFDEEYWNCSKADGRYFSWEKVSVPPTFTRKRQVPSTINDQEAVTWMDVFNAASNHSIYTNSSIAPRPEIAAELNKQEALVGDKRHRASSIISGDAVSEHWDSICDPPNSLCTTTNVKETVSSTSTDNDCVSRHANLDAEEISSHFAHRPADFEGEITPLLEHQKEYVAVDGLDKGDEHQNEYVAVDGLDKGDDISDNASDVSSMMSMSAAYSRRSGISSQLFSRVQEDDVHENYGPASGDDVTIVNSCSTIQEDPPLQVETIKSIALPTLSAGEKVHQTRLRPGIASLKKVNTQNVRQGQANTKKSNSWRVFSPIMDRNFLKKLRTTDLLHTFNLNTDRLLSCLQLMTRRTGYLPAFQIKSPTCHDIEPQVITLHHCAPTYIERCNVPFSGTVRSIPIFYTEDNSGFLSSIFTVNWIPEGVYSLERVEVNNIAAGNSRGEVCFGRILQYSPFASELAFHSDRAYLIGDETTTREIALKTLISGRDEAEGDLTKYFMLMCGWAPPNIMMHSAVPTDEQSSVASPCPNEGPQNTDQEFTFTQHPGLGYDLRNNCLVNASYVTLQGKALTLSQASNNKSRDTQEGVSGESPICRSQLSQRATTPQENTGMVISPDAKHNLMLCLRCGVAINCSQNELDEAGVWNKSLPLGEIQNTSTNTTLSPLPHNRRSHTPRDTQDFHQGCAQTLRDTQDFHQGYGQTPRDIQDLYHGCAQTFRDSQDLHQGCGQKLLDKHDYNPRWEVSGVGVAFPKTTPLVPKVAIRERKALCKYGQRIPSDAVTRARTPLTMLTRSLTTCPSGDVPEKPVSSLGHARSHLVLGKSLAAGGKSMYEKILEQAEQSRQSRHQTKAMEGNRTRSHIQKSPINFSQRAGENSYRKGDKVKESLPDISISQRVVKAKPIARSTDFGSRITQQNAVASLKLQSSKPSQHKSMKQKALQASSSAPHMDKDKARIVEAFVAGWNWNTTRETVDDEKDLLEKRTWTQPVIPPPFPTNPSIYSGLSKGSQKPGKTHQLSKAHLAQHKRNLSHINHSYISPYWSKKEVKRARNKSPTSDSGDDRSSISRITTISGMSSSSSSSNTDDDSSTEESQSDSGSSASGVDFFTRYANKGGPTSVDDIFKRTLPKDQLEFKLNRAKEAKEIEEREQLGYLRGREGATPPPSNQGDSVVKEPERSVAFVMSEYDMCSDADEIKEVWKMCFPEVDFWDTNRRKKFKKRKILF